MAAPELSDVLFDQAPEDHETLGELQVGKECKAREEELHCFTIECNTDPILGIPDYLTESFGHYPLSAHIVKNKPDEIAKNQVEIGLWNNPKKRPQGDAFFP